MAFDALDEASDEALLSRYAGGDPSAARLLTTRLTPLVYRVAARVLSDRAEAEDVTQEVMLRLWHMAPDWRPGTARVTTWLFRVTINLCTDRLRRRRTLPLEAADTAEDGTPGVVAALVDADRARALDDALQRLPDRQRQAVILRHLEGLTNPEIATVMEIGVEAVESLTARGKRALAAMLAGRRKELGYEDD